MEFSGKGAGLGAPENLNLEDLHLWIREFAFDTGKSMLIAQTKLPIFWSHDRPLIWITGAPDEHVIRMAPIFSSIEALRTEVITACDPLHIWTNEDWSNLREAFQGSDHLSALGRSKYRFSGKGELRDFGSGLYLISKSDIYDFENRKNPDEAQQISKIVVSRSGISKTTETFSSAQKFRERKKKYKETGSGEEGYVVASLGQDAVSLLVKSLRAEAVEAINVRSEIGAPFGEPIGTVSAELLLLPESHDFRRIDSDVQFLLQINDVVESDSSANITQNLRRIMLAALLIRLGDFAFEHSCLSGEGRYAIDLSADTSDYFIDFHGYSFDEQGRALDSLSQVQSDYTPCFFLEDEPAFPDWSNWVQPDAIFLKLRSPGGRRLPVCEHYGIPVPSAETDDMVVSQYLLTLDDWKSFGGNVYQFAKSLERLSCPINQRHTPVEESPF